MIYLDDLEFDADIEVMNRNYVKTERYNVTTDDGKQHVKYVSVKQNLTIRFITLMPDVLNSIKQIICSTNSYITLKIPDKNNGDLELECFVSEIGEETVFIDDDNIWWGLLEVTITER